MEIRSVPETGGVSMRTNPAIHPLLPADARVLVAMCDRLLSLAGLEGRTVEIVLTDDREMSRMNLQYRSVPGPTNVLSFPIEDEVSSGLIALSVETMARESFLYGQPSLSHFLRLLAHAFLHLSGLDHGSLMESLTEQAVSQIESEFISH